MPAFLDESRAYVVAVDALVRACLDEDPAGLTLAALIDCVNRRLEEPWPRDLAAELVYGLHGHATRLVERGAVSTARDADGHIVYLAERPLSVAGP